MFRSAYDCRVFVIAEEPRKKGSPSDVWCASYVGPLLRILFARAAKTGAFLEKGAPYFAWFPGSCPISERKRKWHCHPFGRGRSRKTCAIHRNATGKTILSAFSSWCRFLSPVTVSAWHAPTYVSIWIMLRCLYDRSDTTIEMFATALSVRCPLNRRVGPVQTRDVVNDKSVSLTLDWIDAHEQHRSRCLFPSIPHRILSSQGFFQIMGRTRCAQTTPFNWVQIFNSVSPVHSNRNYIPLYSREWFQLSLWLDVVVSL